MKLLTFTILFFISLCTYGQIKVGKKLSKKFENLSSKLDAKIYDALFLDSTTRTEEGIGIALFTKFKIDTLNLKDFNSDPLNEVKILNSDTGLEDVVVDEKLPFPYPDFINAKLINNKLTIIIGFFNPNIIYTIEDSKVESYYEEYFKDDNILQLKLNQLKLSRLKIPMKTNKLVLSNKEFKIGDTLFGTVEFETKPYYIHERNYGFKYNYIHQKVKGSLMFKVPISNMQ
jgi:hypothetical protein